MYSSELCSTGSTDSISSATHITDFLRRNVIFINIVGQFSMCLKWALRFSRLMNAFLNFILQKFFLYCCNYAPAVHFSHTGVTPVAWLGQFRAQNDEPDNCTCSHDSKKGHNFSYEINTNAVKSLCHIASESETEAILRWNRKDIYGKVVNQKVKIERRYSIKKSKNKKMIVSNRKI